MVVESGTRDSSEVAVERDARRVWELMHQRADVLGLSDVDLQRSGVSGRSFIGSVSGLVLMLYPELARSERKRVTQQIRRFLTQTRNAVCVRSPGPSASGGAEPVWWVRREWCDAQDEVDASTTPAEPTSAPSSDRASAGPSLDPRWRREFLRHRWYASSGPFVRIARLLVEAVEGSTDGVELTTAEVRERAGLPFTSPFTSLLHTLADMGLVTVVEGRPRRLTRWSVSAEQGVMLGALLEAPVSDFSGERDAEDFRERVRTALDAASGDQEWVSVGVVARAAFLDRIRVWRALRGLTTEGRAQERSTPGDWRSKEWRSVSLAAYAEAAFSRGVERATTSMLLRNESAPAASSSPPAAGTRGDARPVDEIALWLVRELVAVIEERDRLRSSVRALTAAVTVLAAGEAPS